MTVRHNLVCCYTTLAHRRRLEHRGLHRLHVGLVLPRPHRLLALATVSLRARDQSCL
jgi:hypothetical protein